MKPCVASQSGWSSEASPQGPAQDKLCWFCWDSPHGHVWRRERQVLSSLAGQMAQGVVLLHKEKETGDPSTTLRPDQQDSELSSSLLGGRASPSRSASCLVVLFLPRRPVGLHKPARILATLPSPVEALHSGRWSPMACSETASACARRLPLLLPVQSAVSALQVEWPGPRCGQHVCSRRLVSLRASSTDTTGPRGPLPSTLTCTPTPSPDPKRNANWTYPDLGPPGASWTRGWVCVWLVGCFSLLMSSSGAGHSSVSGGLSRPCTWVGVQRGTSRPPARPRDWPHVLSWRSSTNLTEHNGLFASPAPLAQRRGWAWAQPLIPGSFAQTLATSTPPLPPFLAVNLNGAVVE